MANRKSKQIESERSKQIHAALMDEMARFNQAVHNGATVFLQTFNGPYRVRTVDADFWYHTDGNGGFGQSWCGCNNGTWSELLAQANVARHPLFQK